MKLSMKLLVFFAVAAVAAVFIYIVHQASQTESAIILKERNKFARTVDKGRAANDPDYARKVEEQLALLDYRLAASYNAQNNPDAAIAVLQKLISAEQARPQRTADSFAAESRYQETLARSYHLKKDEGSAAGALRRRDELMAQSIELRKRERRGEGKFVGSSPE